MLAKSSATLHFRPTGKPHRASRRAAPRRHGYDPESNRWIDINPLGKQTTRVFDSLARPIQIANPGSSGQPGHHLRPDMRLKRSGFDGVVHRQTLLGRTVSITGRD
jgi:hypothetical protein